MEAVALNPGRLVAAAVIGLVLLLVLIIKFKVQAMVAILILSLIHIWRRCKAGGPPGKCGICDRGERLGAAGIPEAPERERALCHRDPV